MNPHYEHIRKACIKANPSILDLVMGCVLYEPDWNSKTTVINSRYGGYNVTRGGDLSIVHEYAIKNGTYEILGRPITLQDVLMLLDGTLIGNDGQFYKKYEYNWLSFDPRNNDVSYHKYNLSKPFHEQSWQFYKWCAEEMGYTS